MRLFAQKKRKYFAACEYWVYLPGEDMPNQDDIMTRMVARNPYGKGGRSAIGPREGMMFADVRLHIAQVLRSKNPHVFRPDLFRETVEPSAAVLQRLAASHSLVKARFIAVEPLSDDKHLQFMPHLADALSFLGKGLAVYDVVSENLLTAEEFSGLMAADVDAARFDVHVRVVWEKGLHSGHSETKGLIKKGLPELLTEEAHLDQRVLVNEVMEQAARRIWGMEEPPREMELAAYEDQFRLDISPARSGPYRVRIMRLGVS